MVLFDHCTQHLINYWNCFGVSGTSSVLFLCKYFILAWSFRICALVQIDAPEDIIAEPLPTGLMVTWKNDQTELFLLEEKECEIRSHEKGSGDKVSLSMKSFNCYVICDTLDFTLILCD